MKPILIGITLLPLAACTGGYDDDNPQDSTTSATESRSPYLDAAEERLKGLEAKVQDIKDALADRTEDASEDMQSLLSAIDEKREAAVERLAALQDSGQDALESASDGLQQALDDLEGAIGQAWDRIHT